MSLQGHSLGAGVGAVLLLCRDAFGVYYNPCQLGFNFSVSNTGSFLRMIRDKFSIKIIGINEEISRILYSKHCLNSKNDVYVYKIYRKIHLFVGELDLV